LAATVDTGTKNPSVKEFTVPEEKGEEADGESQPGQQMVAAGV
jgi:hypothetical protein